MATLSSRTLPTNFDEGEVYIVDIEFEAVNRSVDSTRVSFMRVGSA